MRFQTYDYFPHVNYILFVDPDLIFHGGRERIQVRHGHKILRNRRASGERGKGGWVVEEEEEKEEEEEEGGRERGWEGPIQCFARLR